MSFVALDSIKKVVPDVDGRNWVYPQRISGFFTSLRTKIGIVLMGILFVVPLIRINGMPMILFDIPHRRFILFGQVFWPEDVWLLFFLLFAFVIFILLVTAVAGRAWCGYTCPQSVFLTQIFLKIERWVEGDRNQQLKLDRAPWDFSKFGKKFFKHILFLGVATFIAHVFLAYFVDVRVLVQEILHPSIEYKTQMTFVAIITTAIYIDFAFLREQFCNYICPYARFQSALLDQQSLIVAYDQGRGEPRGQARDRKQDQEFGDCIDCKKCVVVCPQGIDIREGLQLECIHCAACVDACDSVMTKIGKPTGLIRYASEAELAGRPSKPIRPRTILYSLLLVGALIVLALMLSQRRVVEATLVRPPGQLHQMLATGEVANRFRIQLVNKSDKPRPVSFTLDQTETLKLITSQNPLVLPPGKLTPAEIFIARTAGTASQQDFTVTVKDLLSSEVVTLHGTSIVPENGDAQPKDNKGK